jgi:cation:H+ antiporter
MWDTVLAIVFLVVGFIMLSKGADWFVDGAAGIAGKLRIPTLVIGLTVVSLGTTAPEVSASTISALQGNVGFAIGNVVGSNITNILLILGLAAVFTPVPAKKESRTTALPVLLAASVMLILFGAFDDKIQRHEGIIFLVCMVSYTVFLIWNAFRNRPEKQMLDETTLVGDEDGKGFDAWRARMSRYTWFLIVSTLVGVAVVIGGALLAIDGIETLCTKIGIPDKVAGLTVLAIGTSLPELITSVVAAKKGETDIAVGNIIGSNIFNILMVAGLSAVILPLPFASDGASFLIDSCIALGAAALLAGLGYLRGNKIKKWGGIVMLLGFVAYYVYLFVA